jgi:hypothetical protein
VLGRQKQSKGCWRVATCMYSRGTEVLVTFGCRCPIQNQKHSNHAYSDVKELVTCQRVSLGNLSELVYLEVATTVIHYISSATSK